MPPKRRRHHSPELTKSSEASWAPGFRPPDHRKCLRAIGDHPLVKTLQPSTHFQPLPSPSKEDWLAINREDGQSFLQFLGTCPWLQSKKPKGVVATGFNPKGKSLPEKYPQNKVYIMPLGEYDSDSSPDLDFLVEFAKCYYCVDIEMLPCVPIRENEETLTVGMDQPDQSPKSVHLTTRHRKEKGTVRRQLRIDTGLLELLAWMPEDGLFLVVVTMEDLYGDTSDLFTAGTGQANRRFGIFSFFRYDPRLEFSDEHWYTYEIKQLSGECKNADNKRIILQRACKLLVHEMGHLFGIHHCVYFSCCMNGSASLPEDFRQPMHLCPVDLNKLRLLTGFDIRDRYTKLLEFYERHGFTDEALWVKERLEFIL